ncbi:MAG TPA: DUF2550 domain-containing protein [Propionibacteriaceae bacterium]|nr:DUF2550 domain-containing protein [Propionibacteriaceae bacterium]
MGWLQVTELVAAILLACLVLPLMGLFVRRRWLSSRGGVFDCGLRLNDTTPGAGWATGIARYESDTLEWYRVFAVSLRPHLVLRRDHTVAIGTRQPDAVEAVVLFSDHQIIRLESSEDGRQKVWELAMPLGSVTGLMSWLEAAPPGGHRYPGLE